MDPFGSWFSLLRSLVVFVFVGGCKALRLARGSLVVVSYCNGKQSKLLFLLLTIELGHQSRETQFRFIIVIIIMSPPTQPTVAVVELQVKAVARFALLALSAATNTEQSRAEQRSTCASCVT